MDVINLKSIKKNSFKIRFQSSGILNKSYIIYITQNVQFILMIF